MKQLSLKFKSDLFFVTRRKTQIDFLPNNPLNDIQLRLDVVQSTYQHPTWCSVVWHDLYLRICLIKYLHVYWGGMLQIYLSNGEILQDIISYENKIQLKVDNEIEYEYQIEVSEFEYVNIGDNVIIYENPTYSFYPYDDAITYSIFVRGFKENDYVKLAEVLKDFLKNDYRIEII